MNPLLTAVAPYRKLLLYLIGVVVVALASMTTDDVLTGPEILQVAIMVCTAFTAYALPDTPQVRFLKLLVGAVGAGLVAIVAALNNGEPLDTSTWLNVALALVSALGLVGDQPPEPAVPPTASTPGSGVTVDETRPHGRL